MIWTDIPTLEELHEKKANGGEVFKGTFILLPDGYGLVTEATADSFKWEKMDFNDTPDHPNGLHKFLDDQTQWKRTGPHKAHLKAITPSGEYIEKEYWIE